MWRTTRDMIHMTGDRLILDYFILTLKMNMVKSCFKSSPWNHVSKNKVNCNLEEMPSALCEKVEHLNSLWGLELFVCNFKTVCLNMPETRRGSPINNIPSSNMLHHIVKQKIKKITCDIWHTTCDMWYMTFEMWHIRCNTWHVTGRGRWTLSQSFSSSALLISEWTHFYGVYRTAPATPGDVI